MHVLGTPPALILSQDQTLRKKMHPKMRVYEVKNWALYFTFCHSSTVKVPTKRAEFYQPHFHLSRPSRDKKPTSVLLTSARQTNQALAPVSDAGASLQLLAICPVWARSYLDVAGGIIRVIEGLSRGISINLCFSKRFKVNTLSHR